MNKDQAQNLSVRDLRIHELNVKKAKEAKLQAKILALDPQKIRDADLVSVDHAVYPSYRKVIAKQLRVDANFLIRMVVEERQVWKNNKWQTEYMFGQVFFVSGSSKNLDKYPQKEDAYFWRHTNDYAIKMYSVDTKNTRPCARMIHDAIKAARIEA